MVAKIISLLKANFIFVIPTVVFWVVYSALYFLDVVQTFPNNDSLLHFDADWYETIRNGNYVYVDNEICNVAFFPFFPYL